MTDKTTGVNLIAAESWGANFADSTGTLKKVLVVDTGEILDITKNSPGEFINRQKLKWFLGKKQLEGKLDEYSVEDIVARAEELNGVKSSSIISTNNKEFC